MKCEVCGKNKEEENDMAMNYTIAGKRHHVCMSCADRIIKNILTFFSEQKIKKKVVKRS